MDKVVVDGTTIGYIYEDDQESDTIYFLDANNVSDFTSWVPITPDDEDSWNLIVSNIRKLDPVDFDILEENGYTTQDLYSNTIPEDLKAIVYDDVTFMEDSETDSIAFSNNYSTHYQKDEDRIKENKLVFVTNNKTSFYGCSYYYADTLIVDSVISLVEDKHTLETYEVEGHGIFEDFTKTFTVENPNTLHLPVKDYQAPVYDFEYLYNIFQRIDRNLSSCLIYCVGGKGRTGTILACFAIFANTIVTPYGNEKTFKNYEEVLEYLRKHYHPKAIETSSQEQYVKRCFEWYKKRITQNN